MGHFANVGFPLASQDDLLRVANRTIAEGARVPAAGGNTVVSLLDPSGAGSEVVVSTEFIECTKPTFLGERGARVRVGRIEPYEPCEWCSALWVDVLDGGETAYPAVVEVVGFAAVRERLARDTECAASFALFAAEVGRPAEQPLNLADRAALPMGTFGKPPRAEMRISGYVLATERRRNALTAADFGWVRVDSLAAEYDVLLADTAPLPEIGSVFEVSGWLLADLDLP